MSCAGPWLRHAASRLAAAGIDSARLDAELLLMHAWGCGRAHLIAHSRDELPADVLAEAERLLARRGAREPLAYLTGWREFWSRDFAVNAAVLIPRPETEHLVEAVLARFPERERPWRFADIGTGSGCLAVTLACEYPAARVEATDISAAALACARDNAERHGVEARIHFRQGDLFAALDAADGPYDAIVSNPPYVSLDEYRDLAPELGFEPRGALTDEADGLRLLARLVAGAPAHLLPGGDLIVETGPCGLPPAPAPMAFAAEITDLGGRLRGGVYRRTGP
jgi:release factor glutamine methyltransferase